MELLNRPIFKLNIASYFNNQPASNSHYSEDHAGTAFSIFQLLLWDGASKV